MEPVYRGKTAAGVPNERSTGLDPFCGKSGSVSFNGLTHQFIEARKLESAPYSENQRSLLWIVAPVVLISSLVLPQFFLGNTIDVFIKNETLAGTCQFACILFT